MSHSRKVNLLQFPKYWDYGHVPLCLALGGGYITPLLLFEACIEPRDLCVLEKYSATDLYIFMGFIFRYFLSMSFLVPQKKFQKCTAGWDTGNSVPWSQLSTEWVECNVLKQKFEGISNIIAQGATFMHNMVLPCNNLCLFHRLHFLHDCYGSATKDSLFMSQHGNMSLL